MAQLNKMFTQNDQFGSNIFLMTERKKISLNRVKHRCRLRTLMTSFVFHLKIFVTFIALFMHVFFSHVAPMIIPFSLILLFDEQLLRVMSECLMGFHFRESENINRERESLRRYTEPYKVS